METENKYPQHNCGKVLDWCIYEDTKIFFCIFCKKVKGAAKEPDIKVTITVADMKEYDKDVLEELR